MRRAHKQSYEAAHQKLQQINRTLSTLKKRPNIEQTTDDINVRYSKFSQSNINNNSVNFNTLNNNNNSLSGGKFSSNNNFNNHNINNGNERRNSTISNSSGSTQYQTKPRSRCDSYGGQSNITRISSPTPSNNSGYYQQHLHYSNHNHLADRIAFVTNAVSAAAAEAKHQAGSHHHVSPKHGRFRKPLTVDTTDQPYYPMSASSAGANVYTIHQQHNRQHSQLPPPPPPPPHSYHAQTSTLQGHSPYLPPKSFHMRTPSTSDGKSSLANNDDDDDDLAGEYATLSTLSPTHNDAKYQPQKPYHIDDNDIIDGNNVGDDDVDDEEEEEETHYSVIENRKPKTINDAGPSNDRTYQKNHIPGQWLLHDNNSEIISGYTMDNR